MPSGVNINYPGYAKRQVIAIDAYFPKSKAKNMRFPYLNGISDELNLCNNGKIIFYERFEEGEICLYIVAFKNSIISLSYLKAFNDANVTIL